MTALSKNSHTMNSRGKEMIDVTLAKGVGIFLVVLGHIVPSGSLAGNDWFFVISNIIYMFHMPFFMAISGYVFLRGDRLVELYGRYPAFIVKQFKRLIVPFIAMGLFVLFGKMIAQHFLHVDKVPESFAEGLKGLFYETWHSPSTFIWYIYVLFVYQVFFVFFCRFMGRENYLIYAFFLAMVLYILPSVQYFYLDKLMPFFIFFVYGGVLRFYRVQYLNLIDRYSYLFAFAFGFSLFWLYDPSLPEYTYVKLIAGGFSVPALHALCRIVMSHKNLAYRMIYVLGVFSYSIYLFNTICIGVLKAFMFKFVNWHGMNFLFFAPILVFGGIIGPMIIATLYQRRFDMYSYIGLKR